MGLGIPQLMDGFSDLDVSRSQLSLPLSPVKVSDMFLKSSALFLGMNVFFIAGPRSGHSYETGHMGRQKYLL